MATDYNIYPGFMGLAQITIGGTVATDGTIGGGTKYQIRCNDISINLEQDTQFYNHTIGLLDTIETSGATKGEISGEISGGITYANVNAQKILWRPGVKIIRGSLSFPVDDVNFGAIFDMVALGKWFVLEISYHCKSFRTYSECRVNSCSISASAGDVVQMTIEIVGRNMVDAITNTNMSIPFSDTKRLLTWDKFGVSMTNITEESIIHSFEMSINNNCIPIYTSGYNKSGSLFPRDIRIGIQEVTGSVTFYGRGTTGNQLSNDTVLDTINLSVASWVKKIDCLYKPIQRSSSMTAPLQTLGFIGVNKVFRDT